MQLYVECTRVHIYTYIYIYGVPLTLYIYIYIKYIINLLKLNLPELKAEGRVDSCVIRLVVYLTRYIELFFRYVTEQRDNVRRIDVKDTYTFNTNTFLAL